MAAILTFSPSLSDRLTNGGVHLWLIEHGVDNIVVDSASIEVNRRARRAKTDRLDGDKLLARRNRNVAAVALAARNARIAWALLAHERSYQHDYVATRKAA